MNADIQKRRGSVVPEPAIEPIRPVVEPFDRLTSQLAETLDQSESLGLTVE